MHETDKASEVSVVKIPKYRALSSGYQKLGELFGGMFNEWMQSHHYLTKGIIFESTDCLLYDGSKFNWIWAVFDIIKAWVEETSGFALDESRGHQRMTHMIYLHDEIKKGLGYKQLQVYVPIKLK